MSTIRPVHVVVVLSWTVFAVDLTTVVSAQEVVSTLEMQPDQLNFSFVEQKVEGTTGFVVGGTNQTEAIKRLESLNGRSIRELEQVMRPGAKSAAGEGSDAGFLGNEERLLDVMAADNAYVVDELGLSHRDLARPLLIIGYYAKKHAGSDGVGIQHGDLRLQVRARSFRGYQLSPFLDGTKTNTDVTIKRLRDGRELNYSLLVPHMIERYGFYEGKGTPYRVDPKAIIELFELSKTD